MLLKIHDLFKISLNLCEIHLNRFCLQNDKHLTKMILSSLRSNVMMACRSSSNSELEVLAWAPRENVFQITVSEGPTDSCQDPDWSNIFEGSHGEITFEYSKCKSTWTRGTWTKTEECDGARCQRGFCWRHDNPFWVDSWANPVSDPDTKWDGVNYNLRCYRLEHGRSGFYPEYGTLLGRVLFSFSTGFP